MSSQNAQIAALVDITAEWDPAREWLGRLMAFVLGAVWDPAKPDAATDLKSILARYRGAASGVRYAEALKAVRGTPRDTI